METETYTPKFKIGHTVISLSGESVIIVGTHRFLRNFSASLTNHGDYDSRDSSHTLYSVLETDRISFSWKWESTLSPYCTNDARGKRMLLDENVIRQFKEIYQINDENWLKYSEHLKL